VLRARPCPRQWVLSRPNGSGSTEAFALAQPPALGFNRIMSEPFFAEPAALMGDPTRANMLAALMDGRAWTAKELALAAGITPQTASGHLAQLMAGGLIAVAAQGRHRYYRLAGPPVAQAIEALMTLTLETAPRHRPKTRASAALAEARTCYDHLAGRLGVTLHDTFMAQGCFRTAEGGYGLTDEGRRVFAKLGLDLDTIARERRPLARPCLDWSERRPHLAGALGAALAAHCLACGWVERSAGTRALRITRAGDAALKRLGAFQCEAA
jgi:DNA-binding transcriptional ArsR family regulator